MGNEISGPRNIVYTSIDEARAGKAADGKSPAPEGAKPVVVEPGDTLSEIAEKNNMSLEDLYALNPQFDPNNPQQSRNPDLIYPKEVVYVKDPEAKPGNSGKTDPPTGKTDPPTGTGKPDKPGSSDGPGKTGNETEQSAAQKKTDVAAYEYAKAQEELEKGKKDPSRDANEVKGLIHSVEKTKAALDDAINAELKIANDGALKTNTSFANSSKAVNEARDAILKRLGDNPQAAAEVKQEAARVNSDQAKKNLDAAHALGAGNDTLVTHKQEEIKKAEKDLAGALKTEVDTAVKNYTDLNPNNDTYGNKEQVVKDTKEAIMKRYESASADVKEAVKKALDNI